MVGEWNGCHQHNISDQNSVSEHCIADMTSIVPFIEEMKILRRETNL